MVNPFFPQLLPIEIQEKDHNKLLRKAISVHLALNTLYHKMNQIPTNLFSTFLLLESVQSTRIEGTQATFDDVMESEVTTKSNLDIIEVTNYLKAIHFGKRQIIEENNPITTRLIKEMHRIVLSKSRGANRAPGEFRKIQNWIGPDPHNIKTASYVPPNAASIPDLISNLEKFINENDEFDPLIAAGILHAQFETIHPFLDGNGRVGRLLIVLYLLKKKVCGDHIIFVSEELERNKYKYYSLLNGLRTETPNWYEWLLFFLDSIEKQADKYLIKASKIDEIFKKYCQDDKIKKSTTALRILYSCFEEPITSSTNISKKTGISITTVNSWLKYFVEIKILYTDDKKRHKIYRFYEILDIIR